MSEQFTCMDCGRGFTLSYEEQRTYRERGLSLPKRCGVCLARRRYEREASQPPLRSPARAGRRPSAFASNPDRPPYHPPTRSNRFGWANPFARFSWLSLSLLLLLGLPALAWLGFSGWAGLAAWLLAINAVTLGLYRYDKLIAGSRHTRVPELLLLLLALLGGSPAAYLAMYGFKARHKTQKGSFLAFYWTIVAGQVVGLLWLLDLI